MLYLSVLEESTAGFHPLSNEAFILTVSEPKINLKGSRARRYSLVIGGINEVTTCFKVCVRQLKAGFILHNSHSDHVSDAPSINIDGESYRELRILRWILWDSKQGRPSCIVMNLRYLHKQGYLKSRKQRVQPPLVGGKLWPGDIEVEHNR